MSIQDRVAAITDKVIAAAIASGLERDVGAMAELIKSLAELNASVTPSHIIGNVGDGAQVAINGSIINGGTNPSSYQKPSNNQSFTKDPIKITREERLKGAEACATSHTPPPRKDWGAATYNSPRAMPDGADLRKIPPGSICFYYGEKEIPPDFILLKEDGNIKAIVPAGTIANGNSGIDDTDTSLPPAVEEENLPPAVEEGRGEREERTSSALNIYDDIDD